MQYPKIRKNKFIFDVKFSRYLQFFLHFNNLLFGGITFRGKKVAAFNRLIKVREFLKTFEKFDPFFIFLFAFFKILPEFDLRYVRRSGVKQWYPVPISYCKKLKIAFRWLIVSSKGFGNKGRRNRKALSSNGLSQLLLSSIYSDGAVMKLRAAHHRLGIESKGNNKRFFK